jgi:hypothetical protein
MIGVRRGELQQKGHVKRDMHQHFVLFFFVEIELTREDL